MQNPQKVKRAVEAIRQRLGDGFVSPQVGLVLGTGLSGLARDLARGDNSVRVSFAEIPDYPAVSVDSHEGAYICGHIGSTPVIAQLGRCHLYEGKTPEEVCMGVRVMAELGAGTLVITNAAGALNPLFEAGSLMRMTDRKSVV